MLASVKLDEPVEVIFFTRFECVYFFFFTRFECFFKVTALEVKINGAKFGPFFKEDKKVGNLQSYWTTTKPWKLTVVLDYYAAMGTYSRIELLRSYGSLQSY